MNTDLEIIDGALTTFDKVSAGIAELARQYGGLVLDCTTTKGLEAAKAARAAIREPRYEIERVRKAAKAPLLALGKKIDADAASITEKLLALEEPLHAQIKAEEDRKEAERQARVQAEVDRVNAIQARIQLIRDRVSDATGKSSKEIAEHVLAIEGMDIGEDFQEFRETARAAYLGTLGSLTKLMAEAASRENEQRQIEAEREELARLRKVERDLLAAQAPKPEPSIILAGEQTDWVSPPVEPKVIIGGAVEKPRIRLTPAPTEEQILDALALAFHTVPAIARTWLVELYGAKEPA